MSQYTDLIGIFKDYKEKLSKDNLLFLAVAIFGALEWEIEYDDSIKKSNYSDDMKGFDEYLNAKTESQMAFLEKDLFDS